MGSFIHFNVVAFTISKGECLIQQIKKKILRNSEKSSERDDKEELGFLF